MLIIYLKNTKFFKRLKFDYVKFLAKFNKSLYMKIKGKKLSKICWTILPDKICQEISGRISPFKFVLII